MALDPARGETRAAALGAAGDAPLKILDSEGKASQSSVAASTPESSACPIWSLIENRMRGGHFSDEIAQRLVESDETLLYYLTLVADRQIAKLKHWNDGNQGNKGMPPPVFRGCGQPSFLEGGVRGFLGRLQCRPKRRQHRRHDSGTHKGIQKIGTAPI